MSAAHGLANEIMWVQAAEIVRRTNPSLFGRGNKQQRRHMIAMEFDQHAAVELANLIERRMATADGVPAARPLADLGRVPGIIE